MKRALFATLSLLVMSAASAGAYEIETGSALICDTQKQAERLASFLDYNVKSALGIVNVEADDPKACGSASVAYIRGGVLGTIRNKSETYQIVEVIVVGVGSDRGFRNVAPTTYVSLVKIDERM